MSYRGKVRNGVVEFEPGAAPPEGAIVRVEAVTPSDSAVSDPAPSSIGKRLLKFAGAAGPGLPEDLAENHDHYIHGTPKR